MTMHPRRRVPLEGTSNFRDLGGYRASDGRTVKWRMLYRSGGLSRLTDGDVKEVSRLNIRLVCDFRGPEERSAAPSRLPRANPPEVLDLGISAQAAAAAVKLLGKANVAESTMADKITNAYRSYPRQHSPQYAALFERLAAPESYPLVFHCAAGKDRTGFAAAMILSALGVPVETIFEDYLLTNECWPTTGLFAREIDAATKALVSARREYLQAALDTIDEAHGSVAAYLRDALGLSDESRNRLCGVLLE